MYSAWLKRLTPWYVCLHHRIFTFQSIQHPFRTETTRKFQKYTASPKIISKFDIDRISNVFTAETYQHLHDKHRQALKEVAGRLQLKSWQDWYNVSPEKFKQFGGRKIYYHYRRSIISALTTLHPEHNWLIWKFRTVPQGYWQVAANQRKYMEWLQKQLNITSWEQWYQVSAEVK
jgi:hypothetical protein